MIQFASFSHPGTRENNEDAASALELSIHGSSNQYVGIAVLGDGVGGNHAGEVASTLAIRTLLTLLAAIFAVRDWSQSLHDDTPGIPGTATPESQGCAPNSGGILLAMIGACDAANSVVLEAAAKNKNLVGMASTIVATVVARGMLFLAWAGDSRAYLFRGGHLKCLTHDHSQVQQLMDQGLVDPAEARAHPLAHVIHRYIGRPEGAQVQTRTCPLHTGDVWFLCSDGLTDALSDAEIQRLLRDGHGQNTPLADLHRLLVQAALKAGASDNTTVLCGRCDHVEPTGQLLQQKTLTASYAVELATLSNPTQE